MRSESLMMNTLLHARGVRTTLLGAMLVGVLVALCAKQGLTLSGLYLLKVACALVLVACLLGWKFGRHSGDTRFGLANQVTLARVVCVVLLLGLLGEAREPQMMWSAVVIAAIASASDALDGWLARRMGAASGFGAHFDMEADAELAELDPLDPDDSDPLASPG